MGLRRACCGVCQWTGRWGLVEEHTSIPLLSILSKSLLICRTFLQEGYSLGLYNYWIQMKKVNLLWMEEGLSSGTMPLTAIKKIFNLPPSTWRKEKQPYLCVPAGAFPLTLEIPWYQENKHFKIYLRSTNEVNNILNLLSLLPSSAHIRTTPVPVCSVTSFATVLQNFAFRFSIELLPSYTATKFLLHSFECSIW